MEESDIRSNRRGHERLLAGGIEVNQILGGWHVAGVRWRERLEKRRSPEVERGTLDVGLVAQGGVAGGAGAHGSHTRIVGLVEGAHGLRHIGVGAGWSSKEILLHQSLFQVQLALLLVALPDAAGRSLIVARHRLIGIVGNTLLHQGAGGTDQTVALADVVVEETERQTGSVALNPQGQLTEVYRQRVEIHAEDTAADHIAHGVAKLRRRGLIFTSAHAGQLAAQAAGGGEEEGTGAAGGIDHADAQDCGLFLLHHRGTETQRVFFCSNLCASVPLWCARCRRQSLIQHRVQGAFDQLLHQFGAGVVAAGGFALRTSHQIKMHHRGTETQRVFFCSFLCASVSLW